jgi:hypothetical protein
VRLNVPAAWTPATVVPQPGGTEADHFITPPKLLDWSVSVSPDQRQRKTRSGHNHDDIVPRTLAEIRKRALYSPVPVKSTTCGLPDALCVIVSEPVRVPGVVGVNVTWNVHSVSAASEEPQSFVCEKSPVTDGGSI